MSRSEDMRRQLIAEAKFLNEVDNIEVEFSSNELVFLAQLVKDYVVLRSGYHRRHDRRAGGVGRGSSGQGYLDQGHGLFGLRVGDQRHGRVR